jgi:NADPH2:quinone reductase
MDAIEVKGILLKATGGPEVLEWHTLSLAPPARGEVRVRHTAIGVNLIDTYDRSGLYPLKLPSSIGREAAGVVEAVGAGVRDLSIGDRVAYAISVPGSYVEARNVAADRLVRVPEGVSDEQAAAVLLKGLTAQYLLRQTYRVKRKDAIVVTAAAGGVGLLLLQWARHLGAHVIAVVGSDAKVQIALEHGAHEVIVSSREDTVARVRAITKGKGVPVVYDSIGKDTFISSLDCLRPRGLMVSYDNASGPVEPISLLELSRRGSLYVTRPTLFHYVASKRELARAAGELFGVLRDGIVKITISQRLRLSDAATAHREIESRKTVGSMILLP